MSENKKSRALEWVDRAESDWLYAKAGEKETAQHHVTCFLCHQAVEKLLKGLLVFHGEKNFKTHHVGRLMHRAIELHPELAPFQESVRMLDKFYIPARYPDDTTLEFRATDAVFALEIADKMIRKVQEMISG